MSAERNNSRNDLIETHDTTSISAEDDILFGLFLGAVFGGWGGAVVGVIWVATQLLGKEGPSLPLGGGLLGVLVAIPLSIVAGVAVLSLVFCILGSLRVYRIDNQEPEDFYEG